MSSPSMAREIDSSSGNNDDGNNQSLNDVHNYDPAGPLASSRSTSSQLYDRSLGFTDPFYAFGNKSDISPSSKSIAAFPDSSLSSRPFPPAQGSPRSSLTPDYTFPRISSLRRGSLGGMTSSVLATRRGSDPLNIELGRISSPPTSPVAGSSKNPDDSLSPFRVAVVGKERDGGRGRNPTKEDLAVAKWRVGVIESRLWIEADVRNGLSRHHRNLPSHITPRCSHAKTVQLAI